MRLFEWDNEKEAENWRTHGILFADAASVFDDPYHLTEPDDRFDYDELRWRTIGIAEDHCMMLLVAHTTRGDDAEVIRIISARHAKPHERRRYGNRKI
jgi:uncharacterized DUF497 family protein